MRGMTRGCPAAGSHNTAWQTLVAMQIVANFILLTSCAFAQTPSTSDLFTYLPATRETYLKFAGEVDATLDRDVLQVWFPRTLDNDHGGFRSNFSREWKPFGKESKFSVFQGRMTWITSQIVQRRPQWKDQYLPYVAHGVDYLSGTLWDKEKGGFYWGLSESGEISPQYTDGKQLYGMSFVIYGLASAYQAIKDPRALEYAQKGFLWIEQHAHDAKNGGYFESLSRDGHPLQAHSETGTVELTPGSGFPVGYKSMNTHIHLLESFSQLYEVWKDDLLRQRVEELLAIVRDKVCVDPGAMNLYFTNAWQPFPDHDSYGHDVETAYLMLEAEDVLGNGHDPRTERMARMLVDHALHYGWDEKLGGFYQEGTTTGEPERETKEWWVEFEGLNALLLMHQRYGKQTDIYFKAFQLQWDFIRKYQIDSEFHGVYQLVSADGKPTSTVKGNIWKAAYHDGRALLNVSERLNRLAEKGVQ
jgi:mannose/cellobiose epimerase-like protein (N-acyl-D-glucosamine 2-epimerase family)